MEIKWTPSMSVNEKTIDIHHKRLLDHLNKLSVLLSGKGLDIGPIRETLHFLRSYITEHFTYEVAYMEKHNYPGLEEHKKIHQEYINFYENFKVKFDGLYSEKYLSFRKNEELLEEARKFLSEWFVHHIAETDRKYAEFIRENSKKF
ncbi:MAG TPA: bacteriohemerythrin [Candidatus Nanoarchaeia archaeon]|nr:bacteriohemerythrin [Candidatus Nanoarchaeia archaeon]